MSESDTGPHKRDDLTGRHNHEIGQRGRWDDANGLVKTLFGVIFILGITWSGFVFTMAYAAGQKNIEQDGQIKAIVDRMGGIEAKQDKQDMKTDKLDMKLDRVLERMPK